MSRPCYCSFQQCNGTPQTINTRNTHLRHDKKKQNNSNKRKAPALQDICTNYDSDCDMESDGPYTEEYNDSQPEVPAPNDDAPDDYPSDSGDDPGPDPEGSDDSTDGGGSFASCQYPSLDSVFSAEQQETIDYNKKVCSARPHDWSSEHLMTTLEAITIILLLSDESSLGYNTTATIFMVRNLIYLCVA
jgi:hypothetical protein